MNTRKLFGIVLGLLIGFQTFSQQLPKYSLYYFNPFLYNPAWAGMKCDGPNVMGLFRKQWTDMPGAPETKVITIDGAIQKKKIGLGAMIVSDKTDLLEKVSLSFAYSYLIKIDDVQGLALGLMAGYTDQTINFTDAVVLNPQDYALYTNNFRRMGFDASAGAMYYWKRLKVGFSVPQLISKNFKYYSNYRESTITPTPHYMLSAQYRFDIKKDVLYFEPNALLSIVKNAKNQVDLGGLFNYKDIAWLGGYYRTNYAFSFIGGIKFHESLLLAYSFDWVNNEIAAFAGPTHEFTLGYCFGKSKKKLDKQLTGTTNKVDSLKTRVNDLSEEVGYLSKKAIRQANALDELADQVKILRVDKERIQKDIKKDDNLPKFAGVVLFNTASYEIPATFKKDLDILVNIMKTSPELRLDIQGHTDDVGSDSYNDVLSDRRVIAVRNYLTSQGVDIRRITVNGLSERFPRVPNTSVDNRALNRRVEIAIIKGVSFK